MAHIKYMKGVGHIGKRVILQSLRVARKLTQRQLAERLGLATRHYQKIEAGTTRGSVQIWQKLVELLGAPSIDYLLQEADDADGE